MDLVDKYSEEVTLYANNMPIEYVIKSPSENIWNYEAPVRTECTVVCDKPKQKNLVKDILFKVVGALNSIIDFIVMVLVD